MTAEKQTRPHPANLHGIDYMEAATRMGPPPVPITDVHTHINGKLGAGLWHTVAKAWGIRFCCSMTPLEDVETIGSVLGDMVRFIAIPSYTHPDRRFAHGRDFLDRINAFHAIGSRMVKFWSAPRAIEYGEEVGEPGLLRLGSPQRREAMDLAASLGMRFMVHVADPDTWFMTHYRDEKRYGSKEAQYEDLERLLELYPVPWIAAHFGGWPEDLDRLDMLLDRHPNLHLDTSATKWMVRELSRHSTERFLEFMQRWSGRILFGSDIVTTDAHLAPDPEGTETNAKATSPVEALDLYASRYWALRHLLETSFEGPSPIADPDLAMIDPDGHDPMDSPTLHGHAVPDELLARIYRDTAAMLGLVDPVHTCSPGQDS